MTFNFFLFSYLWNFCFLNFNFFFLPNIFFSTLLSFLIIIFYGWKIGRKGSAYISIFCNFYSLTVVLFHFFLIINNPNQIFCYKLGSWFRSSYLSVDWGFLFDPLSLTMVVIVLSISLLVQIYSFSYMFFDPSLPRFLSYLSFFVFFMLILVTADNFVLLFLGWEGVGLCSYLLISFWNSRLTALKSALKAMLVNRVGDFFLIVAMVCIFNEFGTLNFLPLFSKIPYYASSTFIFFNVNINLLDFIWSTKGVIFYVINGDVYQLTRNCLIP